MHIETLKIFCDLVETQSFSLAAEKNFITQSAVSQRICSLEERFNRRLINRVRGKSQINLTPAGEVFYRLAKQVIASYEELEESMRKFTDRISGKIKVATVYSVGLHELPPKVREFMSKFPSVKIDIEYSRTTRIVRDVLSGEIELGVVAFPEPRRGITIVPMPSDRLVLICPPEHELAKRDKITVKELKGKPFVMFERDIPTRKAIDRILKSYGVKVRKVAEFDNIETIKRAVEVGFGLAIVPHPSVIDEEKNGQLAVIQLAEKDWVRPVGIIYRSDRNLSLAAKKFIQLLGST